MNSDEKTKISKFLSMILRHRPYRINIILDDNGWAPVSELLQNMQNTRYNLTFEELKEIVDTNDKKRFAFNDDFSKIRASQGHSVKIDLELKAVEPPFILYHGTAAKFVADILEQGLKKMNRQHVHLSKDTETAAKVGARHGKPVILKIEARGMSADGYKFYCSDNGVWLTDDIPAEYIKIDMQEV